MMELDGAQLKFTPDVKLLEKLKTFRIFGESQKQGVQYFESLLNQGSFERYTAGETVIRQDTPGKFLYLLVKGELSVLDRYHDARTRNVVGQITPGEFVGEVTLFTNDTTSAEVVVPDKIKEAILFRVPFRKLLSITDHSELPMEVKIILYRQIVHLLRWRNDLYRIKYPESHLTHAPYTVPPFSGAHWTSEELLSLFEQAKALARRLSELNRTLGRK